MGHPERLLSGRVANGIVGNAFRALARDNNEN